MPGTRPGMTAVIVYIHWYIIDHAGRLGLHHENRPNGTLYTGVTSDLSRRAREHREGRIDGFTKRYVLKLLVFYERYDDIRDAIQRERNMKHWRRAWKVRLILDMNPEWRDLYEGLA
jgi:putative endonuclease